MKINVRLELSALLLIFITLKLCNVIHWSWWWVMSPLWIPLIIVAGFFGLILIVAIIHKGIKCLSQCF